MNEQEEPEIIVEMDVSHFNLNPLCVDSSNSFANILYLNARSLRNSLTDIQDYIDTRSFKIHIVVVTETWLSSKEEAMFFNLREFNAFHSIRTGGRGGDVAIFIRKDFDSATKIFEQDYMNNNFLIVSLLHYKIKIAAVYRQPGNTKDQISIITCLF